MKKLLLLILLLPFAAMADYYPGTVTFNNGSTKDGLIEIPAKHNQKELFFKTDEKAKKTKFMVDDVKEFTIQGEDMSTIKYVTRKLANLKILSTKYKIEDKKSWVRIVREGEVSIMTAFIKTYNTSGPVYYVQKPDEDYCRYLAAFYGGLSINEFKMFKAMVKLMFNDDCPKLEESLEKEDFKAKGPAIVSILYEQVCDN